MNIYLTLVRTLSCTISIPSMKTLSRPYTVHMAFSLKVFNNFFAISFTKFPCDVLVTASHNKVLFFANPRLM